MWLFVILGMFLQNGSLARRSVVTADDHLQTSVGTDIGRAEPARGWKDGLEVLPRLICIIRSLFIQLPGFLVSLFFFLTSLALDVIICPKSSFPFFCNAPVMSFCHVRRLHLILSPFLS